MKLQSFDTIRVRYSVFHGNIAPDDSAYLTDGHMIILRSACRADAIQRLIQIKPNLKHRKPSEDAIRKVFNDYCDHCLGAGSLVGVLIVDNGKRAAIIETLRKDVYVNPWMLRLIMSVTSSDRIRVGGQKDPIVLYNKYDNPVALMMPLHADDFSGWHRIG